jgi:hypothetical protein
VTKATGHWSLLISCSISCGELPKSVIIYSENVFDSNKRRRISAVNFIVTLNLLSFYSLLFDILASSYIFTLKQKSKNSSLTITLNLLKLQIKKISWTNIQSHTKTKEEKKWNWASVLIKRLNKYISNFVVVIRMYKQCMHLQYMSPKLILHSKVYRTAQVLNLGPCCNVIVLIRTILKGVDLFAVIVFLTNYFIN